MKHFAFALLGRTLLRKELLRRSFLLLLLVTASFAQQKTEQGPTLDATLSFMKNTLDRYGWLHDTGKDQEIKDHDSDDPCRVYVESEITDLHQTPHVTYPFEYQFHLSRMDPNSVMAVIPEWEKSKPENKRMINVHVAATDNDSVIWASASNWKESKKVPKILQLSTMTDFDFQFRDKEQAERFAKALKHAVNLCGGKASSF